jgi:hypothetical protein
MKIIDLFFGHKRVVDDKGDHVSYLTRKEAYDALDTQAGSQTSQLGQPAIGEPAGENEAGAARESGNGPREERQQGAQAQEN